MKNGSIIKGQVVEFNLEESIKIQTADGSLFVYPAGEVKKIAKETQEVAVNSNSNDGQKAKGPIIKQPMYRGKYYIDSINAVPKNPLGIRLNRFGNKEFTCLEGDPLLLLQEGKTATYEIDYSHLIITNSFQKDDFATWLMDNDEADSWEENQRKWDRAFRDKYNNEVRTGIRLSSSSKNLHLILHLDLIDFGAPVKYTLMKGIQGGEADADGAIELLDKTTGKTLLILRFLGFKGEDDFQKMGRIEGLFENLGEELASYISKYNKNHGKNGFTSFSALDKSNLKYSTVIKPNKNRQLIADVEILSIENDYIRYRTIDLQMDSLPLKSIEEIRYAITSSNDIPTIPCEGILVKKINNVHFHINAMIDLIDDGFISYREYQSSRKLGKAHTKDAGDFCEIRLLDSDATEKYGFKVYYYQR